MENNDFEIDSFAYPFGARTDSMDDLIQTKIPIVRGVGYSSSSIFGDEIYQCEKTVFTLSFRHGVTAKMIS
jgi:hypothetical protein